MAAAESSELGLILMGLAVLVVGAKLGGVFVRRWGQPSVLGELLFGIALANLFPLFSRAGGLEFVRANETLRLLAQVGVLIVLLDVGLETDLRGLVRVGLSAVLVALIGVIVPVLLGWATARWVLARQPDPGAYFRRSRP